MNSTTKLLSSKKKKKKTTKLLKQRNRINPAGTNKFVRTGNKRRNVEKLGKGRGEVRSIDRDIICESRGFNSFRRNQSDGSLSNERARGTKIAVRVTVSRFAEEASRGILPTPLRNHPRPPFLPFRLAGARASG